MLVDLARPSQAFSFHHHVHDIERCILAIRTSLSGASYLSHHSICSTPLTSMAQQQQLILEFIEKVKRDNYRKDDRMSLLRCLMTWTRDDDTGILTDSSLLP
jgi:hypothetical protein